MNNEYPEPTLSAWNSAGNTLRYQCVPLDEYFALCEQRERCRRLERRNAALRGVITKLKKETRK